MYVYTKIHLFHYIYAKLIGYSEAVSSLIVAIITIIIIIIIIIKMNVYVVPFVFGTLQRLAQKNKIHGKVLVAMKVLAVSLEKKT